MKPCKLPIAIEHAEAIDRLSPIDKDLFDRAVVARAMVEGITLLAADPVAPGIRAPSGSCNGE